MIFLSSSLIYFNFGSKSENLDNEINNISSLRTDNCPRVGNFDFGEIEVISEPIVGGNFNIKHSESSKIAVENDKIYIVWEDENNTNGAGTADWDIFYRYFDGSKWSEIQVISEPVQGQNLNFGSSHFPDIAVENGRIYVVWQDYNNTKGAGDDTDIFYRCNLTGTNWEDIQVISEPVQGKNINTGDSRLPSIAVENGKIYVIWSDNNNTNNAGLDYDIFYICNSTGNSWEDIQVISEPVFGQNINTGESSYYDCPEIEVENGKIYVVWTDKTNTNNADVDRDIFFRCDLIGTWEPVQVISEPVQGRNFCTGDSMGPDIAVENGNIYVVWEDWNNTNGAGSGDMDIFYRCNLTSTGWEDIQVISEHIYGKNFNIEWSESPEIALEDGKIYVVWSDNNITNNAGLDYDIFYTCNFTGDSWEDLRVISEPMMGGNFNTGTSFEPHIAINHGNSHIVWWDENNTKGAGTDRDIFYKYISLILGLGSPTISPIFGNTSTDFTFRVTYFNLENKPPTEITVTIDGTEDSMFEVDQTDINYIDGKDYFFNIKNLDIGVHNYKFWASEGINIIYTGLFYKPIVYNTPPNITTEDNLTAVEDTYYEVNYEYEDIDRENVGQFGTWNYSTNASWLAFNSITATLNGTPTNDDVGEYWVNISIDDTMDIDYTNFILTVLNVNDGPVITINNIVIATEDEYYEVDYEAIDVDTSQNNLIWTMNTNASWLEFEAATAVLNGTPTNDDVGEYWVNISVSDNEYIDSTEFKIKVNSVNDPPRIITNDFTTVNEDEYFEVDYEGEDIDNLPNELIWTISTDAQWLSFDQTTAIINGTPTNDDVGEYWVNISVSDSEYIDFTNFSLTVINTNDPPMITSKDVINVMVGELYSVNYEATDIDPTNDVLKWSLLTNSSDWLTIDSITGLLMGTPSQYDLGSYWVNVSVWDGENGWDYSNFTLYVTKEPEYGDEDFKLSNPKMVPIEGDTNTEFTFSIHYYNSEYKEPTSIQLIVDGNINNMTLKSGENESNGTYEYGIKLSEGIHTYYFSASNGSETIKTDNFLTSDIKKVDSKSEEESSWYWLIWIVIIVIVIMSMVFLLVYKKYKAKKIPTVRAEILHAPPAHLLPDATPGIKGAESLASQPTISEQLPTQKVPVPSLAPTPMKPQLQLPQATLSKAQKLGLLEERFLRGEVTEETYKELKTKIQGEHGEELTEEEKNA